MNKKDSTSNLKGQTGDSKQKGKPTLKKEKYKNHWIDEEMEEIIPIKKKKKKT